MEARSNRAGFWAKNKMSDDNQHIDSEETEQTIPKEEGTVVKSSIQKLHTPTMFSKYLAMVLFVLLPFLGGWVGYQYGFENKVTEIDSTVSLSGSEQVDEKENCKSMTYDNGEHNYSLPLFPEELEWTEIESDEIYYIHSYETNNISLTGKHYQAKTLITDFDEPNNKIDYLDELRLSPDWNFEISLGSVTYTATAADGPEGGFSGLLKQTSNGVVQVVFSENYGACFQWTEAGDREFVTPCEKYYEIFVSEPVELNDYSNWKTYRNEDNGYNIIGMCKGEMGSDAEYFVEDRLNVYSRNLPIASSSDFMFIGELATSPHASVGFYSIGNSVYMGCNRELVEGLDASTTELVDVIYIKDKDSVYRPYVSGINEMMNVEASECTKQTLNKCNSEGYIPY